MQFSFNIDDIKYIKILYMDSNNNPATIKAAVKDISDREIYACIRNFDDLFIKSPQDITLSIVCTDGLYRTKSRIKYTQKDEDYLYLAIETPQRMEYQQNREYFRVEEEFVCIYSVDAGDQIVNYDAKTVDISANGVSIVLPEHVISKTDATLIIHINQKFINTRIKYVRSEQYNNDEYKLSFTFSQIDEHARDLISQVCIKKQLEERRNNAH